MSTLRSKKGKDAAPSSYYPTQWSEWEWDDQERRFARYRLAGPDNYEYDYKAAAPASPRTQARAGALPATGPSQQPYTAQAQPYSTAQLPYTTSQQPYTTSQQPYTTSQNYTHATPSTVSALAQGLAGVSLGASAAAPSSQIVLPGGISGHIRTRNDHTTEETFDPHYKVHGAWEFQAYKIFKVLWAEPNGAGGDDNASGTESVRDVRVGNYNQKISHKVRRFLIIKPDHGFCLCLPISTYTNKGTNKKGIRADTHTIIYTEKKPEFFPGEKEKGLKMKPIKVKAPTRHKLDKASRLNYSKLYTVEYNVKVWFIGKVDEDSQWQLVTDYNRIHPPLVPPPANVASTTEDTFDYAQGGSSSTTYRYPLATSLTPGVNQTTAASAAAAVAAGSTQAANPPLYPAPGDTYPSDPFYGRQQPPSTILSTARSASAPPPVVYSSSPPGGYQAQPGYGAGLTTATSPHYQFASMDPASTMPAAHNWPHPSGGSSSTDAISSSLPTHGLDHASQAYQPASYGSHAYDIPDASSSASASASAPPDQYPGQSSARPVPQHTSSFPDDSSIRSSKKRSGGRK